MNTTYSPHAATPSPADYYYERSERHTDYVSPSPTPSPRGPVYQYGAAQQRPATRAHFRHMSTGGAIGTPTSGTAGIYEYAPNSSSSRPPTFSPRYTSDGHYATANGGYGFAEKDAGPGLESPRFRDAREARDSREREPVIETRRTTPTGPISNAAHAAHIRRSSTAMPTNVHMHARPQTARPSSSHFQGPPPPTTSSRKPAGPSGPQQPAATTGTPPPRPATEADAKRHKIPAGYSLKNWDPSEEPIMLLGSVFDANSLGKWIYDWTTYHHGPQSPISEIAGELWLLLIQLSGKIKRTDAVMSRVRSRENREMLEDFIISGERLTDKLRKLLKTCEAPMMHVAGSKRGKTAQPQLGKGAGIEFVETMFGREREMEKTERFMQSVRLWNLRFDANCEDILRKPTQ